MEEQAKWGWTLVSDPAYQEGQREENRRIRAMVDAAALASREPDMEEQAIDLPEPAGWLLALDNLADGSRLNVKGTLGPAYTADQVRAAVLAERERAAAFCERYAKRHTDIRRAALEMAAENIRSGLPSSPAT